MLLLQTKSTLFTSLWFLIDNLRKRLGRSFNFFIIIPLLDFVRHQLWFLDNLFLLFYRFLGCLYSRLFWNRLRLGHLPRLLRGCSRLFGLQDRRCQGATCLLGWASQVILLRVSWRKWLELSFQLSVNFLICFLFLLFLCIVIFLIDVPHGLLNNGSHLLPCLRPLRLL